MVVLAGASPAARRAVGTGSEVSVSNLPGPQEEPTIAIDPSDDRILLAGSNSFSEGTIRSYSSTDSGATWRAAAVFSVPSRLAQTCSADPGVAIDGNARQYFSYIRSSPCATGHPRLYVASRAGPGSAWGAGKMVARLNGARFDDKPAIAVDNSAASTYHNRAYVSWSRISRGGVFSILLSHSDDGGQTWSKPVKVNRTGREESYSTIAVGRSGIVYVAWDDITNFSVRVARSTDGGGHFEPERTVVTLPVVTIPHCGSGIVIPAQKFTCAHPNPLVTVDTSGGPYAGRVYVTYAATAFQGDQGASLAVFNSRLRPLAGFPRERKSFLVAPPGTGRDADQFWPESAVDPSSGALWVCFYDTKGDPERKRAFYSCTVSRDGGRTFAEPTHAASMASDETQPGADSREYGDYEGLAVAGGVAHPIWTDSRELSTLNEEIYTTALSEADLTPPAPSG